WLPMMLMTGVSELVLRLFGIRSRPGEVAFGRIDLNEFLKEATDNANDDEDLDAEVEYFRNTLELSSIKVREVMIP
ncbi:MAG: hemolysin, partial [Flavobacteriales bacterium]|nr:hemolysin [Flavobacteriales bacterium]